MFDTIQFYYDQLSPPHEKYIYDITKPSFSKDKPNQKAQKLKNLWVWTGTNGRLHVLGSLAKYHLANNIETLTPQQVKEAVQSLTEKLKITSDEAKLSRLDFGFNFKTKQPVLHYQDCMWYCPHLYRWTEGSSLYFGKSSRVLSFYDKLAEANQKGVLIPDSFVGHHLLRYECRYKGNLKSRFNGSEITLDLPYHRSFCQEVIANYEAEFKKIKMFAGLDNTLLNSTTTAQSIAHNHAKLLYNLGPDIFSSDFQQLKDQKKFDKSRDYTQYRNSILKILEKNSISSSHTLIDELTQKVESVKDKFANHAII